MKLNDQFVTHDTGDFQMMVSVDRKRFSGLVKSNETAGRIIDLLKQETSRDEIVETMLKEYRVDKGVLEKDVDRVLGTLKAIGAIDE